jgi:hypothetical protein
MSWIHKQWDGEYIALAEKKIKDTVSLLSQIRFRDVLSTSL